MAVERNMLKALAGVSAVLVLLFGAGLVVGQEAEPGVDEGEAEGMVLFNGRDLEGWKRTEFGGEGEIYVEDGAIVMEMGNNMTGLTYTNATPTMNYELSFEAQLQQGNDFFCGFTFPIATNSVTLIMGGWGGFTFGISSFDGLDANSNATKRSLVFEQGHWYRVKIRVVPEQVVVWLDGEKVIEQNLEGVEVGMRPGEIELCMPLGVATWVTQGACRNILMRSLGEAEEADAGPEGG